METNLLDSVNQLLEELTSSNPIDPKINRNTELVRIELINLTQEVNVPNRIPYSQQDVEEFTKECEEMLALGIIEPSTSKHSAPAFYVNNHNEQKRGKRRMVINYKAMNLATKGIAKKLPRKDYIIERIKGKKWFSSLDAKSGYYQLRLEAGTKELTTFSCPPQKLYQFTVLPMGLKQAPGIFQEFMDRNLSGLEDICLAYLDDIIVFSTGTKHKHLEVVLKVLERCKEKGLILNKKKAQIGVQEIEFLGLNISSEGFISIQKHVLEKQNEFPDKISDQKQLQRFLGNLNYISDQGFLKTLAQNRRRLQKKCSEKQPWIWTEQDTKDVQLLKQSCSKLSVLYNYLENDFLIVYTDASNSTWGAVLTAIPWKEFETLDLYSKEHEPVLPLLETEPTIKRVEYHESENRPASIYSSICKTSNSNRVLDESQNEYIYDSIRKVSNSNRESTSSTECYQTFLKKKILLNLSKREPSQKELVSKYLCGTFMDTEQRYPTHKLETLVVVKALRKWKIDLLPREFILRTDSKYVTGFKAYNIKGYYNQGRLIRWQAELSQFKYIPQYIKGEKNFLADTLTR